MTINPHNSSLTRRATKKRDLLALLSLAQRSQITAPRQDTLQGNRSVRIDLCGNAFRQECTHPLIPWTAAAISDFLCQTLSTFRRRQQQYQLERLIWYYCRVFDEQYLESRFILGSVFMEAIKFYWAKNVAGYPTDINAAGLVRGFIKATSSKGRHRFFTFEELLRGLATHLGLDLTFSFIDHRNALFHSGATAAAQRRPGSIWKELRPELWLLCDQMDMLLLRLLEYRGTIHPYHSQNSPIQFS